MKIAIVGTGYVGLANAMLLAKHNEVVATLQWVHWFNHIRLLEPIGYIPSAEAEDNYYWQLANSQEKIVLA